MRTEGEGSTLFRWRARIKGKGQVNLEPIIWFDFPLAFVNDEGTLLLMWYGELEELQEKKYDEYWLLVSNSSVVDLLRNKMTFKSLILEGKTFLVGVDYSGEDYEFEVIRSLNKEELINNFTLPEEDSYLEDLCSNRMEILEYIENKGHTKGYEVPNSEIVRYVVEISKPISVSKSVAEKPINAILVKDFPFTYSYFSLEKNIDFTSYRSTVDIKANEEVLPLAC